MSIANLQDQNELIRASNRSGGRLQVFPVQTGASGGGMAGGEDDHQRFARLVLPHLGDAYSLARWITANRADAEDVVQDASLRAFRAIANVGEGNSRAWVLTIVRNTAYSWVRKNRPAQLADEFDETVHSGETTMENAEAKLLSRAESERVRRALETLPVAFREVLVLREIEGLSYKEISEVTGVAMGTVMSSLSRARQKLRDELGTAAGKEA